MSALSDIVIGVNEGEVARARGINYLTGRELRSVTGRIGGGDELSDRRRGVRNGDIEVSVAASIRDERRYRAEIILAFAVSCGVAGLVMKELNSVFGVGVAVERAYA